MNEYLSIFNFKQVVLLTYIFEFNNQVGCWSSVSSGFWHNSHFNFLQIGNSNPGKLYLFKGLHKQNIQGVIKKKRTFKDFKERLCQIIQNYILFSCDFMRANEFREKESKIDPIYYPPIKTFKKHTLCYDLRKRFFVFYLFTHGFTTIGGDGKP